MKVLYVVTEAFPFAKEGGLGEVAGEFPEALARRGVDIRAVMPLYDGISDQYREKMEFLISYPVQLALETAYCGLYRLRMRDVWWYFIENDRCFGRGKLYGFADDDMRFAFFSKAVCIGLRYIDWRPEIIHCNDWQTALVPFYLRDYYTQNPMTAKPIKTVFTIHNVEFQGNFSFHTLTDVFGLSGILFAEGTMELEGSVNLMKGAIETADRLTTVSPTYARELTAPDAAGPLAEVIASHEIHGILNGIPWAAAPSRNPLVKTPYDRNSVERKSENKLAVQEKYGLPESRSRPMFGCVSRVLARKGFDLLAEILPKYLERGCQLVMTGEGDQEILSRMQILQEQHPNNMVILPYTEENAAEIFSAADFLLMPSKEEPCGTAQMLAMGYGTVPVVRATGGLKDTVRPFDADHPDGCGFVFADYSVSSLDDAMEHALEVFGDTETFASIQRGCMALEFTWDGPAAAYEALYASIL